MRRSDISMNKGFVPVVMMVIIGLASIFTAGGGYAVYKYKEVVREKAVVEKQLNEQKDKEILRLQEQVDSINANVATSTDEVAFKESEKQVERKVQSAVLPKVEKSPVEPVVQQQVVNTVRLLTLGERTYYITEATKVLDFANRSLESLESRLVGLRKSNYREEYSDVEQFILDAKELYEADRKMAGMIISAVKNASDDKYTAINSAYNIFIESAQETADDTKFINESINELIKLSNEVVEARIKLEVIDELSAEYGVSSSYSPTDVSVLSLANAEARRRADENIKELAEKFDAEKEINNYLIGIVIVY